MNKLIYGPVPSRRLGKSLGVNNIPYKVCSYNCVYCQIGEVPGQTSKIKSFYNTNEIIKAVEEKLTSLPKNEMPDYLSLVPDGEPTLEKNLDTLIDRLKQFSIPIAVISN
ncbi:MAG: radical SAM protein, partial [Bacteroidales bacterium]